MDYFKLFEMPPSLQPDEKTVKKMFYELSRKYHPDFHTNASETEQQQALEQSSQVNKAYKIFQNKEETIRYVLKEKGLLVEEEKYELAPSFLMEMLELNEQLMEAKTEDDAAAKKAVHEQIKNLEIEIYEPVKNIVEHYKEGVTTEEELLQIKDYYYKKKYLSRILAGMR